MAIGLGKRYWVRLVKSHFGDIDSCIEFMKDTKPYDNHQWVELRPVPTVKKGNTTCDQYHCSLVEESK